MVIYDKKILTLLTGPVGYLGSMAADAVVGKGKFQNCMAKMGFECKNNCSKDNKYIAPKEVVPKIEEPVGHSGDSILK